MRAWEFITESKESIARGQQQSTVGLNLFAISQYDRTYDLNRVMMAVASTDGTFVPELNRESWVGKNNTAHPYTKEEQEMLKKAYEAAEIPFTDLNKGDLDSEESAGSQTVSPVQAFKGYPR